MITVPVSVMVEGAVNTPVALIVPAEALHVTEVCPEAVNVCVAFSATETVAGETVIAAGGFKVIVVTADFVESAALVAVTAAIAWSEAGMDFADALHLAAAEACDAFVTFDRKLAKSAAGSETPAIRLL